MDSFNSKKRYWISLICFFIAVALVLVYCTYIVLIPKGEAASGSRSSFFYSLKYEDKNTIDVVFTGDSSITYSVNPIQIWRDRKITSYSMSYMAMQPKEIYYDFIRLLKYQNPKLLVVDVSCFISFGEYNKNSVNNKLDSIVEISEDSILESINSVIPIIRNKSRWSSVRPGDLITIPQKSVNNIFKGYKYFNNVFNFESEDSTENAYLSLSSEFYLKKIISKCNEKGIFILLTSMPSDIYLNVHGVSLLSEFANENNVEYIDFKFSNPYDYKFSPDDDFADDDAHLNYYGATKFTYAIEGVLKEKYDMHETNLNQTQINHWNTDESAFYEYISKNDN